ncbi:MAG: orotidine-5'-phosphate decarboxylase [Chitinophagaceae bacterium]|nr:orotidine-5'-phosphate decarboxylase [Chitinophagaceae bacterium]MCW5905223.1 orotidine-5'-phosphate decarboxylase [Chitinophagaceae bacterium]
MTKEFLVQQIQQKKSYLCVGLDTDITKIPKHLQHIPNAIVQFNKAIIDATKNYCVSYKINTAFYEAMGTKGWDIMEETLHYIPNTHFKIADAKRGDIGNTSSYYAKTFFETYPFDALTVAPYMGEDSIRPFLEYDNKFTIVLGLTSNAGAKDFELLKVGERFVYEKVIESIAKWGTPNNLMFVVGATQAVELTNIRAIVPDNFLLVPGIGFQGGSLREVSKYGMNKECGLLVSISRAIIYAGTHESFAEEAKQISLEYQTEMSSYLL